MSKPRLLMVGDAGRPTGFEKVLRHVATELHATGKYDITIRGLGYDPATATRTYPCTVKPAGGSFADPLAIQEFGRWVEEDRPDVVWCIQDLWNIAGYTLFKPAALPLVTYTPVDCPNVQYGNAMALSGVSEAVMYTHFGALETAIGVRSAIDVQFDRVSEAARTTAVEWFATPKAGLELIGRADRLSRWQERDNYNVIPHGLEQGVFGPRDRSACRKKFGIPNDAFVVTNIGTNQFRKRLDLTLRAFAAFLKREPKAMLVLHCAGNARSPEGYNLPQLARLFGIERHVMLVHEQFRNLTDDELCSLYNTADVNVNTSGGEGWGLCSFESAACGIPQIVPDWSATRELWKDHAMLLPVLDYRIEARQELNTAHAVIDVESLLFDLLDMREGATTYYAERALVKALDQKSWQQVGAAFDQVIENALNEPAPRAMSLAELRDRRETHFLASEVSGWFE